LGASFPTVVISSEASETIGPCSVSRTVIDTSLPPATLMISVRVVMGLGVVPTR
jgi:hypothetical protein